MKNSSKLLAVLLALIIAFSSVTIVSHAESICLSATGKEEELSSTGADDYPYRDTAPNLYYETDEWLFYKGECTSFCAWRLNNNNGVAFNNYYKGVHWGNGRNWGYAAEEVGIRVDKIPAVGAIAWWDTSAKHHVAWVAKVNNDGTVSIEEYNWLVEGKDYGDHKYHTQTISASSPSGYIHIKDLSTSLNPVDLGTKFYANIVATETQSKSIATTGANDEVTETGAVTLLWPVEGHTSLSRGFADHSNKAIDINDANISGATIRAALGGTVVKKFTCSHNTYPNFLTCCYGYGTGLAIKGTDNRYYCYGHMQYGSIPSSIEEGSQISQGQIIGKVGKTGCCTGPCLHFEICKNFWPNSDFVNPENETYKYQMQEYEDLGTKFYANIVATNANTLAVTATSSSNVQLNTLTYSDYQKWYFERQSDKSYKITNVKMNKCLDVAGADPADRTNIQVVASNGNDAQRWYFVKYGAGYRLIPKMNTGSALDITGSKLVDGANSIEYHIDEGSELQRYSIIKTHTISYDANGGTGTIANTTIWPNASFKIKDNAFSREGYTFAGYYVKRSSDNTWFVTSEGWVTTGVYRTNNYRLRLYSPNEKYNLDTAWTKGASENDTFTFYAQWIPNESKIRFVENYSGFNYLLGSDLAEDYSDYISSRTDIYTLTVDTNERLNNKNSLKIIGQSAGSSGNDLRMRTLTNIGYGDTYSPVGIAGDNKTMTLRFYAKSSVDGAKFYVRWGYQSGYKSITLTKEWKEYSIAIPKSNYYNDWLHPYFDKSGTFYFNSMTLSDGTSVTNINSESGRWACEPITISRGSTIPELPIPERDGYTFLGWYTAAEGGEKVTENTLIDALDITLYAHWLKDISYTPIKTVESNGHRYDLYDNAMGWKAAESFCESLGGHLITINTAEEESIASQMIDDQYRFLWIGMQYNLDSTSWEWVTGEDITYTNWRANRPNTQNGSTVTVEEFGMMFPPSYAMGGLFGQWDDNNGDDSYSSWYGYHNSSFICEYDTILPDFIELSESEVSIEVGEKYSLNAIIEPDYAEKRIIWSSDDTSVAQVDDNGVVTAVGKGMAYISAMTVNGLMTRCEVTVSEPIIKPEELLLSDDCLSLVIGQSSQLIAEVYPEDADQTVLWRSENDEIATVDEAGNVTGVGEGNTVICVQTEDGSVQAYCSVYVFQPYVEPERVEFNGFTGYIIEYIIEDVYIYLFDYVGNDKDVVIPDEIEGYPVMNLDMYLLAESDSSESVTVPKSVTNIGNYALGYRFDNDYYINKIDGFIIYGYKNTAAEKYAKENGFVFIALDEEGCIILGDADGDGKVTILDANAIQRNLADLPTEDYDEIAADVDGDGKVTIIDATMIQRWLAGLLTDDRIGLPIQEDDPDDDEEYSFLNNKPSCPECGSDDVAYILYGYPMPEEDYSEAFRKKLEDGEIIFGGCEVGFDSPKWHCNKCGHDIQ